MDMLNRLFKNDQNNTGQGRVYGKAVNGGSKGTRKTPFWRWMVFWARAAQAVRNSALTIHGFVLPELIGKPLSQRRAQFDQASV